MKRSDRTPGPKQASRSSSTLLRMMLKRSPLRTAQGGFMRSVARAQRSAGSRGAASSIVGAARHRPQSPIGQATQAILVALTKTELVLLESADASVWRRPRTQANLAPTAQGVYQARPPAGKGRSAIHGAVGGRPLELGAKILGPQPAQRSSHRCDRRFIGSLDQ